MSTTPKTLSETEIMKNTFCNDVTIFRRETDQECEMCRQPNRIFAVHPDCEFYTCIDCFLNYLTKFVVGDETKTETYVTGDEDATDYIEEIKLWLKTVYVVYDPHKTDPYNYDPLDPSTPRDIIKGMILDVFKNETDAEEYCDEYGFEYFEIVIKDERDDVKKPDFWERMFS
ncbi:hypothetical protein MsAg5_13020 [Methanosarcinaceae archaeon Ag5]|uniref:Uncharacterized protein n=1 Tax=Methanolapillus africanus TaxID=3028297 RepID=A0AAE4SDI4_9EURY|nr:hypothetical protein [Methanosarcinaceae archaeon Ag5]